ncbi:MAG TPA: type 4a pilus biogenesis protein PilO [Acidobacteriota bacterium]|nr:type 4a pilus biogenesis protein PilO [Acidobacteriota bacterium]
MNLQELPYWGQLLIVAGLCAVLGWVFYQFIYSAEVEEVRNMESRLNNIRDEIRKYKPEESRKEELEFEIEQIRTDLVLLEKVFPSEKDDVRVKRFIEEIARDYDIVLDSYRASDTTEHDQYFERVVSLETRGRTLDFMRFFDGLVRKDLVVHIYDLQLTRTAESKMQGDRYPVTASFKIASYVYRPEEEGELEEEGE